MNERKELAFCDGTQEYAQALQELEKDGLFVQSESGFPVSAQKSDVKENRKTPARRGDAARRCFCNDRIGMSLSDWK